MNRELFELKWGKKYGSKEETDRMWKIYLQEQQQIQMLYEAMKNSQGIFPVIGGGASSPEPPLPPAPKVYVVSGPNTVSSLYTVDLATGNTTLVGNTGNNYFTGIAIHPSTGELWGVTNGSAGNNLWKIDKTTGAATLVGNTTAQIPDITIGDDGLILAWAEYWTSGPNDGDVPASLNPLTGAGTQLAPHDPVLGTSRTGVANSGATGTMLLQFPENGTDSSLWSVDLTTGLGTLICTYTGVPDDSNGETNFSNGMTNYTEGKFLTLQRTNLDALPGSPVSGFTSANPGFNTSSSAGVVYDMLQQDDGKILVGGYFTYYNYGGPNVYATSYFSRLNSDGTLDTDFVDLIELGGSFDQGVFTICKHSSGKIIVGGVFSTYKGVARGYILAFNPDWTLNTQFNTNTGTGANSGISKIIELPDGRIMVAGDFTSFNGTTRNRMVILNSDGTSNAAGNAAIGTAIGPDPKIGISDIALQSDGKVVIVGNFTVWNGTTRNNLARLNSNLGLDSLIGSNGADNYITGVSIDSSDRIYLCGGFSQILGNSKTYFGRLLANGSYDSLFNTTIANPDNVVYVVTPMDGFILIGGAFSNYAGKSKIAAINYNGSFNSQISNRLDDWASSPDYVDNISLSPDGKKINVGAFSITSAPYSANYYQFWAVDARSTKIFETDSSGNWTELCEVDRLLSGIAYEK